MPPERLLTVRNQATGRHTPRTAGWPGQHPDGTRSPCPHPTGMHLPLSRSLWLAFAGAVALATGCATPQYQTTVRFVPPTDAAGQACIARCEATKTACQADCQARYAACAKELDPEVETRYGEALKKYETDLKQYAVALRRYELDLRLDWYRAWPYRHPYWPYYGWGAWWPGPAYPPPVQPAMPTREGVRAGLEKTRCRADCGCLPAYDACYVGCGGQRITETRCVKDCPPADTK